MEEELDLWRYVEVLIRRWYLVIIPAFCLALLEGTWTLTRPPMYKARALVAPMKTATQISLETPIRTLSESEQLLTANRSQRLASYAELATSAAVAERVLAEMGQTLPEDLRATADLLAIVRAELAGKSDLIAITVRHPQEGVALAVADAWARAYVRHINQLYTAAAEEPYLAIVDEKARAERAYAEKQQALEAFVRQDPRAELGRRLQELDGLADAFRDARIGAVSSLVGRLEQVDALLAYAEDMRDQVQVGGASALDSNALALYLLKVEALSQAPSYDLTLQAAAGGADLTPLEMTRDLDALIGVLRTRRDALRRQLGEVTSTASQGAAWPVMGLGSEADGDLSQAALQINQELQALEGQLRALRAEHEQATFEYTQLQAERDLAQGMADALRRKEAELFLATQTQGVEVRLATPPSVKPEPSGTLKNAVFGGLAGLVLGALAAFIIEVGANYRLRLARARAVESVR